MEKILNCPVCNFEYSHLIGTMEVITDLDSYKTKEIIIGKHSIPVSLEYEHRSQGNIHLLFRCEDGHFFIKSFDGHKGIVYYDENSLMQGLADYLNEVYKDEKYLEFSLSYELLGNVEKFLKLQEDQQ